MQFTKPTATVIKSIAVCTRNYLKEFFLANAFLKAIPLSFVEEPGKRSKTV